MVLTVVVGDIPPLVDLAENMDIEEMSRRASRDMVVLLHPFTPSSYRKVLAVVDRSRPREELLDYASNIARTGSVLASLLTSSTTDSRNILRDFITNLANLVHELSMEETHYVMLDTVMTFLIEEVAKFDRNLVIIYAVKDNSVERYMKKVNLDPASIIARLRRGGRKSTYGVDESGIHFYVYCLHDYPSIIDLLKLSPALSRYVNEIRKRRDAIYIMHNMTITRSREWIMEKLLERTRI